MPVAARLKVAGDMLDKLKRDELAATAPHLPPELLIVLDVVLEVLGEVGANTWTRAR